MSSNEPLVSGHFVYDDRPRHDVFWGLLYAGALALTTVGGIYSASHRNRSFALLTSDEGLNNPEHCPSGQRLFTFAQKEPAQDFSVSDFMSKAAAWLAISALVSLAMGILFLYVFKWHSRIMTRITIQVQVLLPAIMGISAIAAGQVGGGIILLLMSLLAAVVFYLWRGEIELCARLLGIAAAGLNENPGLLGFVILAKIGLLILMIPLVAFSGFAYTNGGLIANSHRDTRQFPGQCRDAEGASVDCCVWQTESWVAPLVTLTNVTLLWSVFLVFEIRVFTIAGSIAQWYFAPPGLNNTQGTTVRSFRHAVGPSFGSVSLGSLILTIIQLLRQAMEKARQEARNEGNLLMSIATFCLECIYSLVEYLTKFATVRMAITGEAFFDAARRATDLLTRNFLKAYGVWWFPGMVLNMGAFLLSLAWGLLIFTLSWLRWRSTDTGTQEAAILGLLSFVMSLVVLIFFSSVLLNVVDAVFMCYAMDLDTQSVTKPAVHEVFSQVPVGVAVEQPGGDYAYGAPASPQRGATYVPPRHPAAAQSSSPTAPRLHDSLSQV